MKNKIVSPLLLISFIVFHSCSSCNKNGQNHEIDNIITAKKNDSATPTITPTRNEKQTTTFQNIPENNYDSLVKKMMNQQKNTTHYHRWIADIVAKDIDGDSSYITKKCLNYLEDVIDYNWAYDGCIDKKTLYKKWAHQYDLKYANFEHLFETSNCGWETRKITQIEYLGELNNGDWFKLTIKGGAGINDYSTTLIRVIKIIRAGNTFYIDNFISLSQP